MDMEMLKELSKYTSNLCFIALSKLTDKNARENVVAYGEGVKKLIDEAIARQTVTSVDVAEAIVVVNEKIYRHREYIKLANKSSKAINLKPEYDKIDALELAITALQAYQPWVSVEDEKPESEKPVLLFCKVRPINRKYICVGFYAKPKSAIIPCYDDSNCEYDKETDEYYLQEGYYEIIKNWGDYSSIVIDDFVTHWKPIPEPPKGE